jgi:hypothetical protein
MINSDVVNPITTKRVAFVARIVDHVLVKLTDLNHNQSA